MLNVIEAGNPAGPPVVFVHGFMSSNHQWDPNRDRLGAELRMILVEQRGHGSSGAPDDPEAYRPASVIDELDGIRERLGLDRWWLVGHSMGGAVCLRYALEHPDRTIGVAFTNSRAVFGVEGDEDSDRRRAERRSVRVEDGADLRRLPFHPIHATRFPPELQAAMVERADSMAAHTIRHVASAAEEWNCRARLGELDVPVLLVNGRWEKAFQPMVPTARATIRDLRLVELEGGHSINIEDPDGFDRAVLDFVAEAATG